jgi:hypothetical protein
MKTIIIDVTKSPAKIELVLAPGRTSGQAVLVLTDDVELAPQPAATPSAPSVTPPTFHQHSSANGFPPRRLTEHTIVQILRENGGSVRIRDSASGWNIYDEIAARLGVSVQARRRMTPGTGEPAWRPEVGYCRKNLEQAGILQPTDVSGRGVWTLKNP